MINRESNIRHDFLKTFKHPYIKEDFYNEVLTTQQIHFFQELIIESGQSDNRDLFNALLHMQLSLDIHDLIDLKFDSIPTHDHNHTNQLQVLAGDYHSSYFYRLLSENNYLDELYHFITSIKKINEQKMTLLHASESDPSKQLDLVESIHCGLYLSLIDLYHLEDYKKSKLSHLIKTLVYNSQSTWLKILEINFPNAKSMISERQTQLTKLSYTGER